MLGQPGLDLAQLDAEAADLHLEVVAAQKLDVAVRPPAPQVAGPVHAALRLVRERIGDEALGGQLGPVQIAARHAVAADVQLAGHADRHRFALGVEDVDAGVGDRPADGDAGHLGGRV